MQDSTLDTAAWAAQLLQSPWSITGLTCPGTNIKMNIVLVTDQKTRTYTDLTVTSPDC